MIMGRGEGEEKLGWDGWDWGRNGEGERGMWDLARNVGGEECWRGEGDWGWMWVGRNGGYRWWARRWMR